MALTVLLQTSRVSAEATLERLHGLGIDAQVIDAPNVLVKLASGGNYRVRVAVPEEDVARASAELARWEGEAQPRVRRHAHEVQRAMLVALALALGAGALAFVLGAGVYALVCGGGAWVAAMALWVVRSRRAGAWRPEGTAEPGP
jgi:hypothetical protein